VWSGQSHQAGSSYTLHYRVTTNRAYNLFHSRSFPRKRRQKAGVRLKDNDMRYIYPVIEVALSLMCLPAFAQVQGLSIANYELVSTVAAAPPNQELIYRASVVNTGAALAALTANVTTLDPFSVRVLPGAGTLNFAYVPANGEIMSINTVTFLVNGSAPIDFSKLQWTFHTTGGAVANPGPNETVQLGRLVILNGSGSTNPSGVGTLTYSWTFTSVPAGSKAVLGFSSTAFATFTVDVPGNYVIQLTVSNGVASGSASVVVSTSRTPPVANAGPNQTVNVDANVVLNGSSSTSAEGSPLTYAWTLVMRPAGSAAELTGADTVSPTFVADKEGEYQAQLIVNDGLTSSPSSVTITTQITAPVADAGPHQVVNVGALVQLNGAGSTDANGLPLTFSWSLLSTPAGSTATLNNRTAVNPVFTVDRAGSYVAQLIVSNGQLSSNPSTVTITTQTLLAPTANAGQNRTVAVGSQVALSGTGADPQNFPITFQWSLLSKPSGSVASLSSADIPNPTFVADRAGTYVAQLIVNDALLSSTPSTVTISTACSQPAANAGMNQEVTVGQVVTVNGSGSGDVCHDPLTYAWSLTTRPPASGATLSGPNTAAPTFVADLDGVYVVQLIVNNGFANSNPVTVTISASTVSGGNGPILLPANVTVGLNQSVAFPVTLSEAAPPGSVFITLTSTDTSKVTTTPTAIIIPQGATKPNVVPLVNGVAAGSATITASAFGLPSANQLVEVTSGSAAAMSFSPGSLMINGTSTQTLTLILPAGAPSGGLVVRLTSNEPGVAAVPATVNIGENSTSALVPVTGVSAGSATISASAANYSNATAAISVFSTGESVTWYGACWVNTTIYGIQGNFQAIDFSLVTPTPVTVQGTLFFTPNCDPSGGTDNLNDFGTLTGTTHMIQGFTHHPDVIPSSAVYWVGPLTTNGLCPPGSPCSGCVNYTKTTPNCSSLP
jgi:hypothetical protein